MSATDFCSALRSYYWIISLWVLCPLKAPVGICCHLYEYAWIGPSSSAASTREYHNRSEVLKLPLHRPSNAQYRYSEDFLRPNVWCMG